MHFLFYVAESDLKISVLQHVLVGMVWRLLHALALLQVHGLGKGAVARVMGLLAPASVVQELQVVSAFRPLLAQFVGAWSNLLSCLCLHWLESLQTSPVSLVLGLF